MKNHLILGIFCGVFFSTSTVFAGSATVEDLLHQIEALKKENAYLRAELSKENPIDNTDVVVTTPVDSKEVWWNKKTKADKGFLDFNVYYDLEKFSVFTLNAGATLPHQFSYFSLTNYANSLNADDPLRDHDSFYTEQNIRWHLPEDIPIELTAQWTMRSGAKNDSLRLGARWLAHETPLVKELLDPIHLSYSLNFHAFQLDFVDGYQWQMEHVYRWDILPNLFDQRVYLGGFADHNVGEKTPSTWVTEHQLGIRLINNLYGVAEYRYNGFRVQDKSSLGLGLEYVIPI